MSEPPVLRITNPVSRFTDQVFGSKFARLYLPQLREFW
jgi:hypothetical protein